MMERLDQLTVLEAVHPDLDWDEHFDRLFQLLPVKEPHPEWEIDSRIGSYSLTRAFRYVLWLKRLNQPREIAVRLKLPSELVDTIEQAVALEGKLESLSAAPASEAAAQLDQLSNQAIFAVYLDLEVPALKGLLSRYLSSWQHVQPRITGEDLKEKGLPPGPRYAEILGALRDAWLDGDVQTARQEKEYLESLLEAEELEPAAEKPGE
jgi:tRNA nucleotidyltransferase (CCA-adding enzyme)